MQILRRISTIAREVLLREPTAGNTIESHCEYPFFGLSRAKETYHLQLRRGWNSSPVEIDLFQTGKLAERL